MAHSYTSNYVGDGSTVVYFFSFPYLNTSDIKVLLDNVETTDFTFATATAIEFNTAPASGVDIQIRRETEFDNVSAQFQPGSVIRAQDLNENFEQSLYVLQEVSGHSTGTLSEAQAAHAAADAAQAAADAAQADADAAQTTADAAQTTANTAQTTANAAQTTANAAQTTADAALPKSGGTMTGYITFASGQPGLGGADSSYQYPNGTTRTIQARLQDYASVKDFGAVGDGTTDDTSAIQSALNNASTVIFPGGTYSVDETLFVSNNNTTIIGQNATIKQESFPETVFYVDATDVSISGLKLEGVPTKTTLSSSLNKRYNGNTFRTRSCGIYLGAGANNAKIFDVKIDKFAFGIFHCGASDYDYVVPQSYVDDTDTIMSPSTSVWSSDSAAGDNSRYTTTTFQLNSSSQRGANYWVGGYIRILSSDGSTNTVRITGYNSTTNTVTFRTAQPSITLTGSNKWFYQLRIGRNVKSDIYDCTFDRMDFGIGGSSVEDATMRDCVFEEIEETQGAPPHSIYFIGGDSYNARASNLVTYKCPDAAAYKFIGFEQLHVSNLVAFASRTFMNLEACKHVTLTDCKLLSAGKDYSGNATGILINSCRGVNLTGFNMSMDDTYSTAANNDSGDMPKCIHVKGQDTNPRGDMGTMDYDAPTRVRDIVVDNVVWNIQRYTSTNTNISQGYLVYMEGTTSRLITNCLFNDIRIVDGTTSNVSTLAYLKRCLQVDIKDPVIAHNTPAVDIILSSTTENCTVTVPQGQDDISVVDQGTNNQTFITGTVSGDISLADNERLYLGTGNDAELFNNGSHLYLDLNSGIGNFYIRDGSTTRFTFNDNGDFTATGTINGDLTSSDVGSATASLSVGSVGSYGLFSLANTNSDKTPGSTASGSNMRYSNCAANTAGVAPSGTWRVMGSIEADSATVSQIETTVFLRIA